MGQDADLVALVLGYHANPRVHLLIECRDAVGNLYAVGIVWFIIACQSIVTILSIHLADVSWIALLVGQRLSVLSVCAHWQQQRVTYLHQVGQQFVFDEVLRMGKRRFHCRINAHHLVANQIDGLTRIVGTLDQHLGRTVGHFDLGGVAILVGHLECSATVLFHNLVHAVGNDTYGHSILKDDILGCADKDVGLGTNPLLAARCLDAFRDVHVIAVSPRHTEVGMYVNIITRLAVLGLDGT